MPDRSPSPHFATTRWSIVARAGAGAAPERGAALAELCELYWYPVYAFARRRGADPTDAEDHVQAFFADLLERGDIARADRERGRFRSFLLAAFNNFESKAREREGALKRGGGQRAVSLDGAEAERRLAEIGSDAEDPERLFLRTWALTLLEVVVERLGREYEDSGRGDLFAALRPTLVGDGVDGGLAAVAEALGSTEGAVKVAAHRLRQRFAALLRREVGETLVDPDEVEDEVRGLFEALA
ncbi:RNA polymerase sigma factor [Engelhardtia mirabilis]|uniref:RNA polymerase sigma factor n=1 Tax=Engelhardtia mirabilis TaxID=2528011 RepID=A0A518BQQ6_9BACT|nr:hypothetical protein Pla133_44300 [Planctomycetes bacterium Pla133]QDV03637.1 hypothetical protein Pla86_44280 [Planctomycetes bacterium Pla86]